MTVPIIFQWANGAMYPLARFRRHLSQYEEGEYYRLAEVEDRSMRSHNHYFAAVKDGWLNLPEIYAQEFATPEHLRKRALIECGYYEQRTIALSSHDDALQLAVYARSKDEYAVVSVNGSVVVERTAKSQAVKAMGKKAFQKSKQDVLDWIDALLGVEQGETAANAGQAA